MAPTTARHSFISFSSQDEKRARAVCDELERRSVPCWISSRDVRPGRNYQSEIIEAIRSATHLILIFSDKSNQSEEVARELSLASKNRIPICPVRIKDVLPTGGMEFMLATSQWVDAFEDWNGAMERLAAEIAGLPMPPPKPIQPAGIWRRFLPILAGSAALSAIALAVLVARSGVPLHPAAALQTSPPPATESAQQPQADNPATQAALQRPTPQPRAHLAEVEQLAGSLDCAHVVVGSTGAEEISLSGFVQSAGDEDRLLAAANGLKTFNDLAVLPYPFCAVHGLAAALGATDDITIDINHPDGRYLVGDSLSGSFKPDGNGKLWVAADLIQFDGGVTHLLPAPGRERTIAAGERVAFGAPKGRSGSIEAADPPGPLILLVIASDKPLPPPAHAWETARAYLPRLKEDLAKLDASLSISTYDLTITRSKP